MRLYHYTCDHGRAGIERDGFVKPGLDGLVWLTDLLDVKRRSKTRQALGLTSNILNCDRFVHVFEVEPQAMSYREAVACGLVSRTRHMGLVRPWTREANWYVSVTPVAVVDPEERAS